MLDAIRSNDTARRVLDKIPGSQWVQMGLDKLSGMIRAIENIRHHLSDMQETSAALSGKVDKYLNNQRGDPTALQQLLQEIEKASAAIPENISALSKILNALDTQITNMEAHSELFAEISGASSDWTPAKIL